eukprot:1176579-Prorocentrum_minimum.AAC.3
MASCRLAPILLPIRGSRERHPWQQRRWGRCGVRARRARRSFTRQRHLLRAQSDREGEQPDDYREYKSAWIEKEMLREEEFFPQR